jgi:tetraacyldisaccharide 4'-kinase
MTLPAPPPSRSPWQRFYGGAHALRVAWYRDRAARLPIPVVSVGNLHWGGSGKTPLVAAIAEHLRDGARRVAILSRGYGRQPTPKGEILIASTGDGPLFGPDRIGDEPALLAGSLPGVSVVVGADRAAAGRYALERLVPRPDLFLLDDGFSHLRLARDLDILAFPAADPFGGGRLAPGGRLREPLTASRRAHCGVLTGVADTSGQGALLTEALRPHGFRGAGFASRTLAGPAVGPHAVPLAQGARVVAVAAIGRPDAFFATVAGCGFDIAARVPFRDHHPYSDQDVAALDRQVEAVGAVALLATSKDAVKLRGRTRALLAEIPIRAVPEPGFWSWLDREMAHLAEGRG